MIEYYKKPYTLKELFFRDTDIQLSCNKCGKKTESLYLVTKNHRDYLYCSYHTYKYTGGRYGHSENKAQEI